MTPDERMDLSRCWNDIQRQELQAIAKDGAAIVRVLKDDENDTPEWAYTMGLWHTFGHPEVLVIGQRHELTQTLMGNITYRIRDRGLSFRHGSSSSDVILGYECFFRQIDRADYGDWFAANRWFYGDDSFEAVQMVWPSVSGVYPWQHTAPDYLKLGQPLLCSPPKRFLT